MDVHQGSVIVNTPRVYVFQFDRYALVNATCLCTQWAA